MAGNWLFAVVLATLCVAACADTALLQVKRRIEARTAELTSSPAGGTQGKDNCAKGWLEVADGKCCPRDHPTLILGDCYAPCEDGHDDLTIGTYVGCRGQCEGGEASTVNTCLRDSHARPRTDAPRQSVRAQVQTSPEPDTDTVCAKDHVKVALLHHAKGKGKGGCCPKATPILIGAKCYAECENERDAIAIADFVGCRAHCPAGFAKEDHNECQKEGEDNVEREDYPREGVTPDDRRRVHIPTAADGCPKPKYAAASETYCCPVNRPVLHGLLCYPKCPRGYEEVGYGCRRPCPTAWKSTMFTCSKGGRVISRKGYERHPVGSKRRDPPPPPAKLTDPLPAPTASSDAKAAV